MQPASHLVPFSQYDSSLVRLPSDSHFDVHLLQGACEGAITPAFMIVILLSSLPLTPRLIFIQVTSMFYTREEQTLRVGYWCKLISAPSILRRL